MKQLPNNCRVGKLSVFPKDWDTTNAKTNVYWRISYWFYDDDQKSRKQVQIQGMNHLSALLERQNQTKAIINHELYLLQEKGYNPIKNTYAVEDPDTNALLSPKTEFTQALKLAYQNITAAKSTMEDLKLIMDHVEIGAKKLNFDVIPIYDIKKRHIRAIFDYLAKENSWSGHSYNKYRSYLMILFSELSEYDAVESNIPRELKKKKITKKARTVLSKDERIKIKTLLENENRRFYLFVQIFFHSGSRISEFFRIKVGDISLEKQTFKVTIMKGRQYVEVIKPIKDIAVPYWKEYLVGCKNKDYFLMGPGLFPAPKNVRYDQIRKRWTRWAKNKLGIEADFYSLKHLNTDEVSEQIGIESAQKLNSHTSARTTRIYAINEAAREIEIIKKVGNEF